DGPGTPPIGEIAEERRHDSDRDRGDALNHRKIGEAPVELLGYRPHQQRQAVEDHRSGAERAADQSGNDHAGRLARPFPRHTDPPQDISPWRHETRRRREGYEIRPAAPATTPDRARGGPFSWGRRTAPTFPIDP